MQNKEQLEEVRKLCPYYSDSKCYYEMNEISKCDCECEFGWCFDIMIANGYRKVGNNENQSD